MPIYEYECAGCGKTFEVYQKHNDPAPAKHDCGSTEVRRVMSRTSFVLKGTGWYVTDYGKGRNGGSGDDKGSSGSSGSKGSSDSGKSSAKSADSGSTSR